MITIEFRNDEYWVTTDRERIDVAWVHRFLEQSYWAKGISLEIVKASVENSLCFGLFRDEAQIGFARAITDRATFAYLADIFIDEAHRGKGLGKWLVQCIFEHPDLLELRRWMLITDDMHGFYEKFGFTKISAPERFMEIRNPGIYEL